MLENPYEGKTFEELIAEEVKTNAPSYATSILSAFQKGDSGAIKIVMQAVLDSKYQEDGSFPITDDQYKQIIQLAARRLSGEFNPTGFDRPLTPSA